ncbi:KilA-N domain-containing protein [Pseudomonas sp. PDM19]|uniref:KilA-N domain-containing protein n=1 Tax=Pseudomonas sp. PDM19 TaxID=2769272 RepID=UPI00177E811F|nr:KilA-N domain-containing protein [Pseudomonas sp. PDM19]MBD9631411.1 KilA-N domain-containing protein [Pseudomonas sp. PDM19]
MNQRPTLLQIQRQTSLLEYAFIRRDAAGRYNLANIHEMAGGYSRDKPGNWRQGGRLNDLIDRFRDSYPGIDLVVVVNSGPTANRGTYPVEELAKLYASWVSEEHSQRIREAIAAGKPFESDEDLKIKAIKIFSHAIGLENAANDPIEPMSKPALIRFVLDYISTRRVVAARDIRDVLFSVTGEEITSNRIGIILVDLGCEWKTVGSTKLQVTPLGVNAGLSLDSTDNELTDARQDDLDGVRERLNRAGDA